MKRNLLYCVHARQCSMLAYNLYLLHKHHGVFNGRKIVRALEDRQGHAIDELHVDWMLNDTHCIGDYEMEVVPSRTHTWEDCYVSMLEAVESQDPEEISFLAATLYTKSGISQPSSVERLSALLEPMYVNNLGDAAEIDGAMSRHPCGGTFLERDEYRKHWIYYGGFLWINHAEFFRPGWRDSLESIHECPRRLFECDKAYNFGGDEFLDVFQDREKRENLYRSDGEWDMSKVTLVTTCMNRWEFLRQSLPTWLGKGFSRIIVVDWSSDDDVGDRIAGMPAGDNLVTVLRVDGETIFNGGMARNTGARAVDTDYTMFIDSDMTIDDWSATRGMALSPGKFYHGPHNIPPFGTSIVHMGDFWRVNGYSELYPAYGWEDNDLYNRLEDSGARRRIYDERIASHIEHSDDLRARHRDQKGRMLHETVWSNRDIERWTPEHVRAEKEFTWREFRV